MYEYYSLLVFKNWVSKQSSFKVTFGIKDVSSMNELLPVVLHSLNYTMEVPETGISIEPIKKRCMSLNTEICCFRLKCFLPEETPTSLDLKKFTH